ncbi:MAG: response regulator [Alphaproteobacteria bacterium]|nr:response regulator [Alphaproteobacteria bacterium]MBV9554492.1 response regulator [Alphaproteobacteria bacterium]
MARILLVEDDAEVRVVFEHVLVDDGHEVEAVTTFVAGDEQLTRYDYDLLVTDGRLPDGTGLMLADRAATRQIPCLIVTGYAFSLREEPGIDLSRYTVLLKPIRPSELIAAVRQALKPD